MNFVAAPARSSAPVAPLASPDAATAGNPSAAAGFAGASIAEGSIFSAPFDALDDAALLAHLQGPRGVHIDLVVDEGECTPERMAGVMRGEFEFNGEAHTLPDPQTPQHWLHNPSADIEWHILLHKFYYAAGLARDYRNSGDDRIARRWAALLEGWMAATPPGFIAADVTGRRVQNWIYSLQGFVCSGASAAESAAPAAPVSGAFVRRVLESLHTQVEFLCAHLTPKRNHRTLELYAIFLAGVAFPEMRRAEHWRNFALRETVVNMGADLLADGVHCELSTDYHHLALRNWLHVRTLAVRHGVPVPPEMDRLLEKGLHFSLHVHKPDGVVPSLSDGDARSFLPLLAQGAELFGRDDMRWAATRGAQGCPPQQTLQHFGASGYCVMRSGWGTGAADFAQPQYLVFDCGPLGEGNHGHLDALSFELAAFGRSLVVDPGRYTYSEAGDVNWRVHFRGTSAHNTVCVDGCQQTRYEPRPIKQPSRHAAGAVRHKIAGPAPDTRLLECAQTAGQAGGHAPALALLRGQAASHAYDVLHERSMVCVDGRYWIVSDALQSPSEHDYTLNFQLAPAAQGRTHLQAQRMDSPQLTAWVAPRAGQHMSLAAGWVSERYGHKLPAPALRCRAHGASVRFDTVLLPWCGQAPASPGEQQQTGGVQWHPVHAQDGRCADALQITLPAGSTDAAGAGYTAAAAVVDTWFQPPADTAVWQLFGLRFSGHWLHLRHDLQGRLLRAISHADACCDLGNGPLQALQRVQAVEAVGAA